MAKPGAGMRMCLSHIQYKKIWTKKNETDLKIAVPPTYFIFAWNFLLWIVAWRSRFPHRVYRKQRRVKICDNHIANVKVFTFHALMTSHVNMRFCRRPL